MLFSTKSQKQQQKRSDEERQPLAASQGQSFVFIDWGEGSARRGPEQEIGRRRRRHRGGNLHRGGLRRSREQVSVGCRRRRFRNL